MGPAIDIGPVEAVGATSPQEPAWVGRPGLSVTEQPTQPGCWRWSQPPGGECCVRLRGGAPPLATGWKSTIRSRVGNAEKQPVALGDIQETLLIPLLARAVETERNNGLVDDRRAVEIVAQIDYDFDRWRGHPSLPGACLRTRIFDDIASAFLREHPEGTIVEIGCGLNTRFERIDNGRATWIELDLPDSIALRRRFFDDAPRRTMVVGSVLDEPWLDVVEDAPAPSLLLAEAVLIYLQPEAVRATVTRMAERFGGSQFVTDICGEKMTSKETARKAMRQLGINAWFEWTCNDARDIQTWHPGIELVTSGTMPALGGKFRPLLPFSWRAMMRLTPWLVRRLTEGYEIAHFRFGKAPSGPKQ
ncbi:MAG: class I SAM-dependent methyltransferase [Myxococcota bacterium]